LLVAEIVCIFQWFNPFAYFLKREIRENHEFIADRQMVVNQSNEADYRLLLLENASQIKTNELAHNFSYSLLKRRLHMMNKPKRPLKTGIALLSTIMAIVFVVAACSTPASDDQINEITKPEIEPIEDVFTVVEIMPEYPGGMDSLGAFLGRNIKYPVSAKEAGISGTVFVNFIIEKDGSIGEVKTLRGISTDCDNEASRVVRLMPNWTPGKQRGENVRVSFNLPIRFKLDETKTEKNVTRISVVDDGDQVYEVVEQMPEYPGGFSAMSAFLAKNIEYPEQAKKEKITGRVFVSFVVEKNGEVSNVKILRGIGGGCDEEALRVVSKMPKWKPGKDDNGNSARVQYNLPIKFALD
jgi:TonB family protein